MEQFAAAPKARPASINMEPVPTLLSKPNVDLSRGDLAKTCAAGPRVPFRFNDMIEEVRLPAVSPVPIAAGIIVRGPTFAAVVSAFLVD